MIEENGSYSTLDLRSQLIILTMLKQKAGNDGFSKMYQGYRKLASQPNFNKKDYQLPDLMNKYYSENSKQDFTPSLERLGLKLTGNQAEINRSKAYPAVASLVDVVPKSELERARDLIDPTVLINSNFEMVTNSEIVELGLKGELSVSLKSGDIKELKGMTLQLKEGNKVVQKQIIQRDSVTFEQVPNGVYTVMLTGEKSYQFTQDKAYVYVKEAQNESTITVQKN